MSKTSLSNQLLGKQIVPDPSLGDVTDPGYVNGNMWGGMLPTKGPNGKYIATIDAVWLEEGVLVLAAHDPYGNTKTFYYKNVRLKVEDTQL